MVERVALLGEDRGHRSHQELNALRPQLSAELDLTTEWVSTDSRFDIGAYDGVWLVPGSPYADDDAVLRALTVVRERDFPDHPFYVTSMYEPHIGALAGRPVQPLVRAFTAAVRQSAARA